LSAVVFLDVEVALAQAGKVYWAGYSQNPGKGEIRRAELDGSNIETVFCCEPGILGLAIDPVASKLYWSAFWNTSAAIRRADLDGSNIETLIDAYANSIAIDGTAQKIYWAGPGKIQRANLDGSGIEDVLVTSDVLGDIELDVTGGKMYFTVCCDRDIIQRANLDGSEVESLESHHWAIGIGLDLVQGKLYFGDIEEQYGLWRSNLDGSGETGSYNNNDFGHIGEVEVVTNAGQWFAARSSGTSGGGIWTGDLDLSVSPHLFAADSVVHRVAVLDEEGVPVPASTFGATLVSTLLMLIAATVVLSRRRRATRA
jgi:hypothetical protein